MVHTPHLQHLLGGHRTLAGGPLTRAFVGLIQEVSSSSSASSAAGGGRKKGGRGGALTPRTLFDAIGRKCVATRGLVDELARGGLEAAGVAMTVVAVSSTHSPPTPIFVLLAPPWVSL